MCDFSFVISLYNDCVLCLMRRASAKTNQKIENQKISEIDIDEHIRTTFEKNEKTDYIIAMGIEGSANKVGVGIIKFSKIDGTPRFFNPRKT